MVAVIRKRSPEKIDGSVLRSCDRGLSNISSEEEEE
jgi:hypothetical protein